MKGKLLFLSLLLSWQLFSQSKTTSGHLIRINLFENNVSMSDTVDKWTHYDYSSGYVYEDYINGFDYLNRDFFLKDFSYENPASWRDAIYLINKEMNIKYPVDVYGDYIDCFPKYNFNGLRKVISIPSGKWIVFISCESSNISFLSNEYKIVKPIFSDSIGSPFIANIAGRVGNNYLFAIASGSPQYLNYYLEDLSNSPNIKMDEKVKVVVDGYKPEWALSYISALTDSLYLVCCSNTYYIMKFSDNSFSVLKILDNLSSYNIFEINNESYVNLHTQIAKIKYDGINNNILLDTVWTIDQNSRFVIDEQGKYFVQLTKDTLYTYDFITKILLNKTFLKGINHTPILFVSPPFAYIQSIESTTGITDRSSTPTKFDLLQNYPNPFNPTTSINYSIPEAALVIIKIYDALGREVATLVNEYKPAGNYKVEFNASKLVSGVYFYRMESGSYSQTKKLLLLK
jgi:hypothetical protein